MAPKVKSTSVVSDNCTSQNGNRCALSTEDLLERVKKLEKENDDLRAQINNMRVNDVVWNPATEEPIEHLGEMAGDQEIIPAPGLPLRRGSELHFDGVRVRSCKPACKPSWSLVDTVLRDTNSNNDEHQHRISFSLGSRKKNRYTVLSNSLIKMISTRNLFAENHSSSMQNPDCNTSTSHHLNDVSPNNELKFRETPEDNDDPTNLIKIDRNQYNEIDKHLDHLSISKKNRRTMFQNNNISDQLRKRETVVEKYPAKEVRSEEITKNDSNHEMNDEASLLATIDDLRCFDEFMLFSKDLHSSFDQMEQSAIICEGKNRFLDPFTLVNIDCMDIYPLQSSRDTLEPGEVEKFICPEGIKLRIIPRVALDGAKRLGWTGRASNEYKLLVFTRGDGSAINGVVISTLAEITSSTKQGQHFINFLSMRRDERNAARKICNWLARIVSKNHTLQPPVQQTVQLNRKKIKRSSSFDLGDLKEASLSFSLCDSKVEKYNDDFLPGKENKKDQEPKLCKFWTSLLQPTRKTKGLGMKHKSEPSLDATDESNGSEEFLSWDGKIHHIIPPKRNISERARKLGREAFAAMNTGLSQGDVLILERCYVIIGGNHDEQFTNMRLLQNMILLELEENGTRENNNFKPNLLKFVGKHSGENDDKKIIEFRHKYLQLMQEAALVHLPENARSLGSSRTAHNFSLPSFEHGSATVAAPLPLPNINRHWGVSALFSRIHAVDMLLILKTLIIERSVLIIGDSSHLVTSCTCALRELLTPYEWASTFMPLLPSHMLDFVNSPVPFIIGIAVENTKSCQAIEKDERILDAISTGLTCINLSTNSVTFTTETGVVDILKGCPTPKRTLVHAQNKLQKMHSGCPALRSFEKFIEVGLSEKEISAIDNIRKIVSEYLLGLSDSIGAKKNGWQNFGVFVDDGEAFDFILSTFVDSLNKQLHSLECRVKFQELMAYSQLFVEFVDTQRKIDLARKADNGNSNVKEELRKK